MTDSAASSRCDTHVGKTDTGFRTSCLTHGCEQLDGYPLGAHALRAWTCDHGLGWRFILEHDDNPPRMTDLSGLKAALTSTVEHNHYAGENDSLVVYRYHGKGRTERLTWDYVLGTGCYTVNDTTENSVPHTYPAYRVTGQDGTRYLDFVVALAEC